MHKTLKKFSNLKNLVKFKKNLRKFENILLNFKHYFCYRGLLLARRVPCIRPEGTCTQALGGAHCAQETAIKAPANAFILNNYFIN